MGAKGASDGNKNTETGSFTCESVNQHSGSTLSLGIMDVFMGCEALATVNVSDNVTDIGRRAFDGTALTSFTIPAATRSIGYGAFYECEDLAEVTISDAVVTIGNYAFARCSALDSLTIPDSVQKIGTGAYGYRASLAEGAVILSDATICASRNSAAQKYAEDMGLQFVDVSTMTLTAYAADAVYYFGDVNSDQIVDAADVQQMRYDLANGTTAADEISDINGDGVIDAADVLALQAMIQG